MYLLCLVGAMLFRHKRPRCFSCVIFVAIWICSSKNMLCVCFSFLASSSLFHVLSLALASQRWHRVMDPSKLAIYKKRET